MANLIIQDTFEPYYVGRDGGSGTTEKSTNQKSTSESAGQKSDTKKRRTARRPDGGSREEIILPVEAAAPTVSMRRERRAIAHH